MRSTLFSNKNVGFSAHQELLPPSGRSTAPTQREAPVLGYKEFYTGALRLFWGSEKWGVVLPMEVAENLPVIIPVSTRKSDAGATLQVRWVATDGAAQYVSGPIPVSEPGNVEFVVIPGNEIKKFSGKTVHITYGLNLHDNEVVSPVLEINVAPLLIYKEAIIEGLVDGVLNISDYPNGLNATIPAIENLSEYNAVSLFWTVTYDTHLIFQHSQTLTASKPSEDFLFKIPPHAYSPYPGFQCELQYYIWLGAEMDPSLRWSTGINEFMLK